MTERSAGILASATAAALFGSAYVATAFQLQGFSPLGAALWRSSLATVVLAVAIVIVGVRGRRREPTGIEGAEGAGRPAAAQRAGLSPADRLARLLVLGVFGGLVFIVGMNVAVSTVGSTITSFVAGLYAITAALFAPVILGERLERRAVAGFVVALVGTALLAELGPSRSALVGLLAGGVAAVSFGLYLVLIRRWSRVIDVGPLGISLTTAGVAATGLAIGLGLFQPRSMLPSRVAPDVIVATGWLVFVTVSGPIFATIALRRIEAALASSLLLINPITATILSALLLAERPSAPQLLGGVLVLGGMAIATDLVGAVRRRRASAGART